MQLIWRAYWPACSSIDAAWCLAPRGLPRIQAWRVAADRGRHGRARTARWAGDPRLAPVDASRLVEISSDVQVPWVQLVVVVLCTAIPYAAWWYVVVPNRRREIASSKRRGDIKEYLQDLSETPSTDRKAEKWMYDRYLREAKLVDGPRPKGLPDAVGAFEDGLQENLPGGGFWSFDNPVFVYFIVFAVFVVYQLFARALGA